ncbi:transcriptional regulator with XRE-family HTH domain [Azospirillum agricola]|uniref:helix-turn-helix transcriptional regulator n=1 Tax=Azospirillum agricola TaxID=1720247 RepID=UPI001AE7CA07|nr:helix-turn-helix transcriptional regulator [Azospirillum agricola]MBP2232509.1 transcriptional regulator with XRE-family HTH domain [Azospirillum agricola]
MSAGGDLLTIINALVVARIKRGLTQEHLAQKLGVTRQCLSAWEKLTNFPPSDKLFAWAKLLGIRFVAMDLDNPFQDATENCATETAVTA